MNCEPTGEFSEEDPSRLRPSQAQLFAALITNFEFDESVDSKPQPSSSTKGERPKMESSTVEVYFPQSVSTSKVAIERPICGGCTQVKKRGAENELQRRDSSCAPEYWHEACLVCFCCGLHLGTRDSCYFRDCRVFCHDDYMSMFALKCGRCSQSLDETDLVHRCLSQVFHVQCFACIYCGQQLTKGDQYLVVEGQIICRQDYELYLCNSMNAAKLAFYDPDTGESTRKAPKRPRTILTSSQRRAFKASFELSSKPCRKVRETLARETGLSVRVVQVWFQNQRAKMKKIQRKQELQRLHEARKQADQANGLPVSPTKPPDSSDEKMSSVYDDSDLEFGNRSGSESPDSLTTPTSPAQSLQIGGGGGGDNPIDKLYSMQTTYFY